MNIKRVINNNIKLLKYVIRFAPELFVWRALIAGISVVLNIVVGVGFIKFLTDAIQYKYGIKKVVIYIMVIAVAYLINSIINSLFNCFDRSICQFSFWFHAWIQMRCCHRSNNIRHCLCKKHNDNVKIIVMKQP